MHLPRHESSALAARSQGREVPRSIQLVGLGGGTVISKLQITEPLVIAGCWQLELLQAGEHERNHDHDHGQVEMMAFCDIVGRLDRDKYQTCWNPKLAQRKSLVPASSVPPYIRSRISRKNLNQFYKIHHISEIDTISLFEA